MSSSDQTEPMLSVDRDDHGGDTIDEDGPSSRPCQFLRSGGGVKGGQRPSIRTGAQRRPLAPTSTAGESTMGRRSTHDIRPCQIRRAPV